MEFHISQWIFAPVSYTHLDVYKRQGAIQLTSMITCKGISSFSQKAYTVGKDNSQKYVDYKLCMISNYEPNVTYDYSGTLTMNNNGAGSDFDQSYTLNSSSMPNPICIDFSMTK